jgi:hypothetical protein
VVWLALRTVIDELDGWISDQHFCILYAPKFLTNKFDQQKIILIKITVY